MNTPTPTPLRSRRRFLKRTLQLCVGAGLVGAVDAFAEPYLLDTTHQELLLPQLPKALDGVKVAQLTDLHRGNLTPDAIIQSAIRHAAAFQPDLVVLTGDFVRYDAADAGPLAQMLTALTPRLGMLACLGNHDYGFPEKITQKLEKIAGVRMLRNDAQEALPGLWVAGIEDMLKGYPNPHQALATVPPDAALLFLTHNPVGVRLVEHRPCVALAGHTHGGQVRIPGQAPHYPPGMEGFPQIDGWGSYGKARLYISRGIGVTAHAVRFNCRPELSLFTLRAA